MTESFSSIKVRTLENRLPSLSDEYEAANTQLSHTLGEVDRLRIQRQIATLETKIKQVEAELRQATVAETAVPVPSDTLRQPDIASEVNRDLFKRSLADVLTIKLGRNGQHPFIEAASGRRWVRLKIETEEETIQNCWGQIYNIDAVVGGPDPKEVPLAESQTSILSWDDGWFGPTVLEPDRPRYLQLAWRSNDYPRMPKNQMRVSSALGFGYRDVESPQSGVSQDFIPLKPGEYVLEVRIIANGYKRVELKYRLVWPNTGGVDNITLSEVPLLHDPTTMRR